MKIAITGHTKGIGKALFDLLSTDYECLGFSRSTGYNISAPGKILQKSTHADIFINNAYHETDQELLFELLLKNWKEDTSKTIVNINSRAHYSSVGASTYSDSKISLWESSRKYLTNRKCRIINVSPGYVDTDMVAHQRGKVNMITAKQCAEYIKWAIEQPIEIYELALWKL